MLRRLYARATGGFLVYLENCDGVVFTRIAYKTPFGKIIVRSFKGAFDLQLQEGGKITGYSELRNWKFVDESEARP